jgi:Raf kinase inhibitor-like YbhB/YbcL family protein
MMRNHIMVAVLVSLFVLATGGCGSPGASTTTTRPQSLEGDEKMAFQLTSSAFEPEGSIPAKYTCQGEDTSPSLQCSGPPVETASFALIMDDPDAPMGTWVHWVLYNLPGDVHELSESLAPDANLPDGSRQDNHSWGRTGYGGPCPPSGTHRYFFKLYALDALLHPVDGATKEQLLEAMEGHILAQTELMGRYRKG